MGDQGSDAARPGFVLREIELFRDLTDDEVAGIGAAAPMRQAGAGQVLYTPVTPTEVLHSSGPAACASTRPVPRVAR